MIKKLILLIGLVTLSATVKGQNLKEFQKDIYPIGLIDSSIVLKRGLDNKMNLLTNCNWANRIGKKIDVFWLQTEQGNFFGHSFEYFLDCDNLRFIYWSNNPQNIFPIVDFMIEDLEQDSKFVTKKNKHLKNKRKYKPYLNLD